MVRIELNEHSAEDLVFIAELQAMGFPDEIIQKYYDMEIQRRKGEGE